ncbi:MAG: hypothetical protein DRH24_14975 [Deltaproteobacteria bacterium]|nr:MAG: hypothetical protein DRH24_14975 [Deltaproteobacteria bacterium]
MQIIKSKKGFFLTIATILLILPLIFLISYYTGISETGREDSMGKMRCDELHYFVEDVRKDMERSVTIFGRRAAIYALDYIVETGRSLKNYTFICTSRCNVDCGEFSFDGNGSEAAIAELTLCGTLFGKNVTYMINHTIPEWTRRIEEHAIEMHFVANLSVAELRVVPIDAWHFALIVDYKIKANDEGGMCFYTESITRAMSNSSIIGLEDPLYMLQTEGHVMKYIDNCNASLKPDQITGCGTNGGMGSARGHAVFYTNISNMADYRDYCSGATNDSPTAEELENYIFVVNKGAGLLCAASGMKECFNISSPRHFGGVISYKDTDLSGCDVTIPWIAGTGDMDNVPPHGYGGAQAPGCNDSLISSGDCIIIQNLDCTPEIHRVLLGFNSNETNTSCYYVSDIEENYNSNCTTENYSNGPCFFDRLDGNLNLSQKYVDQSLEYFNNSLIGLETIVDLYELKQYSSMYPSIEIYPNATWVDYLYWQNVSGCSVMGYCGVMGDRLKLDCPHSYKYEVDTSCSNVTTCP